MKNYKNHLIALSVFLGLFSAVASQAAYTVEIPLPGLPASVSDPGEYVRYLFIFGLSLAGFLAVGAVAVGGVQYMLAGASIGNTQKAKELIVGALMGVGLLLGSYLLLYTIDPKLTNLSPKVPPIGNVAAPPKNENTIGAGAKEYKWTNIPKNQYCRDVLGAGWETVDATRCQGASPGLTYDCCGQF